MFYITSKGVYGISAILELADNYGNGLLQIKAIAQKRKIPKHYLVQLLNRLLKSGLIKSVRGNKGGYELNDDPGNISFLQVLELLEGAIELEKSYPSNDAIKELLKGTEKKIKQIFDISLAELLLKQQQYDKNVMFHI
ncbi:RrF2 family transcriptional regulator [Thermodesulfobacteriota bacterium]